MTKTRTDDAARFVQLFHMCDWIHNDEREELAADLGLRSNWRSHAAYMEARAIAGLSA